MRCLLPCLLALTLFCGCQPPAPAPNSNSGGGSGGGTANSNTTSGTAGETGTDANASVSVEKTLRIAVIPKGTTHEFWKSVHFGAAQAGEEFNCEIEWLGPRLEGDREGQITVVQNFITQGVDGICLAPLDSQALIAPVNDAVKEGIPVVIFDSGLDDDKNIVSYVATDNYRGGELAAEEMAKRLGKGNAILLRYTTGSESTLQREEGFLKKLKDYPDITVISSDQYSGTTPESSLDKAQQVLEKYRDDVHGVFAVCEPNANGVLGAIENAKLGREIVFIGFDPNERMVNALAAKKMHGIVLQDPVTMGYEAVKTLAAHLRGHPVRKRIPTGEYIATPENMNDPDMVRLLKPKQFGE